MSNFQDALVRLRVIAEALSEDDPDRKEMLSVEGDYQCLMEWALRKRNEYIAYSEAAHELATTYRCRSDSFGHRADGMRDVVKLIMDSSGERKYQGVAATASVKVVPPKPIVLDESILPEKFFITERLLKKALVNEAIKNGETIPGVGFDNGSETISIRSK